MRDVVPVRELLRLDGSEQAFLQTSVEALPRFTGELFSVATRYTTRDGRITPGALAARGQQSLDKLSRAFQIAAEAPPDFMGADHALTSITQSDSWNESAARAAELSECADFVGTVIDLGAGRFAMAGAGTADRIATPRKDLRAYEAIHMLLAINLRVRDALGAVSALDAANGLFAADGKPIELRDRALTEPDTRRALSALVRARERQGGFNALADAEALVHWNQLTAGGYVLLDHVDSDQRRYVVAYKLEHSAQPLVLGLNERERLVIERILLGARNKTIASELGISNAHVS
ncbi:MAG TPA: hypothetical protein VI299_03800, partial [Polyangiales bacterium]